MKALTRYAILLASFLVIFVNVGYADGTDPNIKTVGGGGSTPIFGTSFSFSYVSCDSIDGAPPESYCFNGRNDSPVGWTNLQVTTNYSFAGGSAPTFDEWSCGTMEDGFVTEYSTCTIQSVANNLTTMTGTVVTLYSGGDIPNSDGTPDFYTTETGVTATTGTLNANVAMPEPGTLALLLTGFGALAARRRLRPRRS
jgi:hypothetical protein